MKLFPGKRGKLHFRALKSKTFLVGVGRWGRGMSPDPSSARAFGAPRTFPTVRTPRKMHATPLTALLNFYLFRHSRGTVVFPNLLGLFCPFPENLRSYCLSENPNWPIFVPKTSFLSLRNDISLTENLRRLQVFRTDIPPKRSLGCP